MGLLDGILGGKKSGGCCNMEIVEETETPEQDCGCCCGGKPQAQKDKEDQKADE